MRFDQMGEFHYLKDRFMVNLNDDTNSFTYGDRTVDGKNGFHQLQNHYYDFTHTELPYDFSE